MELPTGDAAVGFGNDGMDFALGAVGEWRLSTFAVTLHGEHTFVHTPDSVRRAGLEYADVTSGGVGLEMALTQATAALLQVEVDRSVLRNMPDVHLHRNQFLLWIGLRSRLTDSLAIEFVFGEDLTDDVSPDFTAFLGFTLDLGR